MKVEVEHGDAPLEAVMAHRGHRHRDVVERAEAGAAPGGGVVKATEEVHHRLLADERVARGFHRAAHPQPQGAQQLVDVDVARVDREDGGQGLRIVERLEVVGRVHPGELLVAGRLGVDHLVAGKGVRVEEVVEGVVSAPRLERTGPRLRAGDGQPVGFVVEDPQRAAAPLRDQREERVHRAPPSEVDLNHCFAGDLFAVGAAILFLFFISLHDRNFEGGPLTLTLGALPLPTLQLIDDVGVEHGAFGVEERSPIVTTPGAASTHRMVGANQL